MNDQSESDSRCSELAVDKLVLTFSFLSLNRFEQESRWAETGDRYVLKLFRDYVFHSVDEVGNPVLDLSHVLTALNKVSRCFNPVLRLCFDPNPT